jgi:cysteine desulfurase
MKRIYLDNAATTPVHPKVSKAMMPYFSDEFGNASSIHSFGQNARSAVDESRQTIAKFLNCEPGEIIFTSGGSESDNLAVKGICDSFIIQKSNLKNQNYGINYSKKLRSPDALSGIPTPADRRDYYLKPEILPHVITTQFEHHAVLDTVKELESEGRIEATYIKPNKEGLINPKDVESAIKENTVLISIMYVNNEIGTKQSIREIGKMIERNNRNREIANRSSYDEGSTPYSDLRTPISVLRSPYSDLRTPISDLRSPYSDLRSPYSDLRSPISVLRSPYLVYGRIFFHTDAVQAPEYCNMDVKYLHVDLLTISAHKIYGPKGAGALFVKKGTPIKHQIVGGGQEYKLRAGTENVASIVGFAEAVNLIQKSKIKNQKHISNAQKLRDRLIKGLIKIPGSRLNGSCKHRTPNNVNISFDNAEGESILINLDMAGVAASSGSACTSSSIEPSHVLTSIGLEPEKSHGSVRFTLGRNTTKEDIDYVIKIMPGIVEKLRKMSPFK